MPVRMVAAVDVGEDAASVVAHAVAWARRLHATLDLAFASEWSTEGLPPPLAPTDELDELWKAWQERAGAERSALVALLASVPAEVRGAERFITGRPVEALPDLAAQYDLMVTATHARIGLERVLLGSVTHRLVRNVVSPLLIVGRGDRPVPVDRPLRVLAPLDEREDGALGWIARKLPKDRVEIVHVLPPDRWLPRFLLGGDGPTSPAARREALEADLHQRAAAYGFAAARCVLVHRDTSNAGDAIVAAARQMDADVVVMPTHTRSALEHLFIGSVAERVVEGAPCPVIVVPKNAPVG